MVRSDAQSLLEPNSKFEAAFLMLRRFLLQIAHPGSRILEFCSVTLLLNLARNSKLHCYLPSILLTSWNLPGHMVPSKGLSLSFLMFIYFGEIERQNGGGAEREGATESQAGSRLRAVSTEPDAGLEPMKHGIMTWATQVPQIPRFLL